MKEDSEQGVLIEARRVPFPRSISEKARTTLAALVGPDGLSVRKTVVPAAHDLGGWVLLKEGFNARMVELYGAVPALRETPTKTLTVGWAPVYLAEAGQAQGDRRAILDIHGGALVFGAGELCRMGAVKASLEHGVRCYAVDYRMPPMHPYPAALDDCIAAYRFLLEDRAPEEIVVTSVSAGGNLAAALMLRARDEGLPLPAAIVLRTPEVDLTESGDTFQTNQRLDVVLDQPLMPVNLVYAAGADLSDPYLSPLFGDFGKGFPPTFLQSGTRDLFLSNTVRMHRALRRAGVPVELHVFEGMPHGGFMGAPEDAELTAEVQRFVAERWSSAGSETPTA